MDKIKTSQKGNMKNKKKNDFCLLHKHILNVIILLNTVKHCHVNLSMKSLKSRISWRFLKDWSPNYAETANKIIKKLKINFCWWNFWEFKHNSD